MNNGDTEMGSNNQLETLARIQPKLVHLAYFTGPLAWIEVGDL